MSSFPLKWGDNIIMPGEAPSGLKHRLAAVYYTYSLFGTASFIAVLLPTDALVKVPLFVVSAHFLLMEYNRDFSFDVTSNRSMGMELIWCANAMYSCYVLVTILALEVVSNSAASSVWNYHLPSYSKHL